MNETTAEKIKRRSHSTDREGSKIEPQRYLLDKEGANTRSNKELSIRANGLESIKGITPEKLKRVDLLGRLSRTPYNASNQKHTALLDRLWKNVFHNEERSSDRSWKALGFKTG